MKRCAPHPRRPGGYTLIEVLTAAFIMGLSLAAAVSLSSTMMLQEEMSCRVTASLNYQENSARLWQLGLSQFEIISLMPGTNGNPLLTNALATTGTTSATSTTNPDGIGTVETATQSIQVNSFSSNPGMGDATSVTIYRPSTR